MRERQILCGGGVVTVRQRPGESGILLGLGVGGREEEIVHLDVMEIDELRGALKESRTAPEESPGGSQESPGASEESR
jgi:hypothetical protein